MTDVAQIWSYLSQGPLLWLTATLVAYGIGDAAHGRNAVGHRVDPRRRQRQAIDEG